MFVLAHLTDPHLPPPRAALLTAELSKGAFSRLSWILNRRGRHSRPVLDALVADLLAARPDHIAVTGDLVNFSHPAEFAAAEQWLRTLGSPEHVTVSPGNHDALVAQASDVGLRGWAPWFGDDGGEIFPQMRLRNHVAIVNLSTAVPTPLFTASGRLGGAQISRLAADLDRLHRDGFFRIVLIHHPVTHGGPKRRGLTDAPAFRQVIRDHGAELILHGHAHESIVDALEGPSGPVPVLGTPSASYALGGRKPPAAWRRITIHPDGRLNVEDRGLGPDGVVGRLATFDLAGSYSAPVPAA